MKPSIFVPIIKAILPALMGAFGGVFAASYPALHASFCVVSV